eukprot:353445-Chlamydomonas_euryale.AAC.19
MASVEVRATRSVPTRGMPVLSSARNGIHALFCQPCHDNVRVADVVFVPFACGQGPKSCNGPVRLHKPDCEEYLMQETLDCWCNEGSCLRYRIHLLLEWRPPCMHNSLQVFFHELRIARGLAERRA